MNESSPIELRFHFLDELVLRTPALPFISFLDKEIVNGLLGNDDFLEAIYLASPVLYNECIRLKKGQITDSKEVAKISASLIKYYQRMYSRCTPFGLFSGCSLVTWGEAATNIVLPARSFLRSTRLDMHYLCALGQHLSSVSAIKERLLYFPNNSRYRIGNEIRYVEYRYAEGKRIHQISSVIQSAYAEAVLEKAAAGASTTAIQQLLMEMEDVTEAAAAEFVDEMIASQLLVSELDPSITGDEFVYQLLSSLRKINLPESAVITNYIVTLEEVLLLLGQIDLEYHNSPVLYQQVIEKIQSLGVLYDESKLFQVDINSSPARSNVNENIKKDLTAAVSLLASLFSSSENDNLNSFAERFRKRYEDQQVPLLQVLDAETGIGYIEQSAQNLSPLMENLVMPARAGRENYQIKWNKTEQWLFDRLIKQGKPKEIVIDRKELADFTIDFSNFPPSFSVMFSLAAAGKIIFKGCSGSSAANLLGRFAHADEKINELVLKIVKQEQEQNEEVVFAEIVHLPEDRVGNILLHPAFREYEIPYLASSSLPDEKQIHLQDILVSVTQDKRIRLFSKKLNKEIIPRLSNAHNYSFRSLPVYHFLADMQAQGLVNGLAFNWGSMARHFSYLPRVSYSNVILFEATWQLRKEDFEQLVLPDEDTEKRVKDFQSLWKLPRYFVLADGDNELLVDGESKESIDSFIRTIRGREFIILKEFLLPENKAVKDENGMPYNNQFVAVLMNTHKVYNPIAISEVYENAYQISDRNFLPGTEWLYYKIYCGTKTADEILVDCLKPLTEELLKLSLIDKWFFIRYNDPEFHLRIRLHIPDIKNLALVMELFLKYIQVQEQEGLVWKIQTDTYSREVERYGGFLMEETEDLFFADSKMKMQFLLLTDGDEREKFRWLWGLRGVEELLNAFQYSLENKYELMQNMKSMFAKEFNADKNLYRQINQQYSDNRKFIQMAMENPASASNEMKPLIDIYDEYKNNFVNSAKGIISKPGLAGKQGKLNVFLSSIIHMNLNRLFLSEPRLHEMVIYDFLCAYYRSLIKRK